MRVRIVVTGIVQGVGFRPFIYREAVKNNLTGYVRNMGDAGVEVLLDGSSQNIDKFMSDLNSKKPPLAQIDQIRRTEILGTNGYTKFTIYQSLKEVENSGSIIPPDVAICNQCLRELRDPKNPRFDYFFITCTDCGPRFTIIEQLPYDRENTAMKDFPLCGFCKKEYVDPKNRRFHAQTVACPICGPKAYLTTNKGVALRVQDPMRTAGKLLSEGKILAIKGYGGFHIAASTTLESPLSILRKMKFRQEKPFAIMARSIDAVKMIAEVNSKEQELLTSPQRPIVLLNKNKHYNLSPLVAPNLHNIGVMLPYTGLHYMLFDQVENTSFVMTSANPPNQPILNDDIESVKTLGETVDYFLFHNRKIANRCDDSVMRVHGSRQVFLRRSRGYSPTPIRLKKKSKCCVVGLGGELNNTSCVLLNEKVFVSQHIGDVENIETQNFLQEATGHLYRLTNCKAEAVVCDLHPKFTTTTIAKEMAQKENMKIVQVQHHHAHAAALMAEHNLDDIIAITCDGYGYGLDGEAWGGEIFYSTFDSLRFSRLGHLEPQSLLGGDLASHYPLRIAAGILDKAGVDIEGWLLSKSKHFPHGVTEAKLVANQLKTKKGIVKTTSCGRILDAVAAILGICFKRSYEGEPAMKLESVALSGKDVLNLAPIIKGGILETTSMFRTIYNSLNSVSTENLANSAHIYLAKGLALLAIQKAIEQGVKNIGFTGGAACNQILSKQIRETVESEGFNFYVHESIPAGDGGISFGQAVIAGFSDF